MELRRREQLSGLAGTASAMLPHRVPEDVAAERQQTLMEIQRKISRARHEAMVGKDIAVLVEFS